MGTVEHQCDHIARAYLVVAFYGFSIYMYEACLGSCLNAVTRLVLHVLGKKLVDAQGYLPFVHLYAEMLIELAIATSFLLAAVVQIVYRL